MARASSTISLITIVGQEIALHSGNFILKTAINFRSVTICRGVSRNLQKFTEILYGVAQKCVVWGYIRDESPHNNGLSEFSFSRKLLCFLTEMPPPPPGIPWLQQPSIFNVLSCPAILWHFEVLSWSQILRHFEVLSWLGIFRRFFRYGSWANAWATEEKMCGFQFEYWFHNSS